MKFITIYTNRIIVTMSFHTFAPTEAEPLSKEHPKYSTRMTHTKPPIIKAGAIARFFQAPLQNKSAVLGAVSGKKHLYVEIENNYVEIENNKKSFTVGFYPNDGDIFGASFYAKSGELWTPDPLAPDPLASNDTKTPLRYPVSNNPVEILMSDAQREVFNSVLQNETCYLIDGTTSSGANKEDRLQCKVPDMYYATWHVFNHPDYKNCITWLQHIFPTLKIFDL